MSVRRTHDTAIGSPAFRLRKRARARPERIAYTFLDETGHERLHLRHGELSARVEASASALAAEGLIGERALLLLPPGLDFVVALLACLRAGVVVVPAFPPRRNRRLGVLARIARDAEPRLVVAHEGDLDDVGKLLEQAGMGPARVVAPNELGKSPGAPPAPEPAPDDVALLQYSSGSTGDPRGVVVTHRNLAANQEAIRGAFDVSDSSVIVGWLPFHHDMGLIGNVLQPVHTGTRAILMPPTAFLRRPATWLEAITRYRATISGGPDFAYDHCVRRVLPEQRAGLDLHSWRVAFDGAEPVRAATLARFAEVFGPVGFDRSAFVPCYGLAESTLFVTGATPGRQPAVRPDPETGSARRVGCGRPAEGHRVVIADPESRRRVPDGAVGEVWVAGPSVARGYWRRDDETARSFGASLDGEDGAGEYLRTGDLGFLADGELFVTGRLKDLIVLRGRNLYPQDLEATAERAHPAVASGVGAAFAVEGETGERLTVVQEIDRRREAEASDAVEAIRAAIAAEHEVPAAGVVILRRGAVPRTTSGKVRRRACRRQLLAGELAVVSRFRAREAAEPAIPPPSLTRDELMAVPGERRAGLLASDLGRFLSRRLEVPASRIDPARPLVDVGLDSLLAVEVSNRLGELGAEIDPDRIVAGATLEEIARDGAAALGRADAPARVRRITRGEADAGQVPVSFGQRQLWLLERLLPPGAAYNLPLAAWIRGPLSSDALLGAATEIARRHDSLRTTFTAVDGEPWQRISERVDLRPVAIDLTRLPASAAEAAARAGARREARRPFDLERGPLFRLALWRLPLDEHLLLVVFHHAISDGWSLDVFGRELAALYEPLRTAEPPPALPDLPLRYADFALWQRGDLEGSERTERDLDYWRRMLADVPPLELPADRPPPTEPSFLGSVIEIPLPDAPWDLLTAYCRRRHSTRFAVLLGLFHALLGRLAQQDRFAVGVPAANRPDRALEHLIGFFVNTLALPVDLGDDPTVDALTDRSRASVLAAFRHQNLPFEKLVEDLRPERDRSHSPLFQSWFAYHRASAATLQLPGLECRPLPLDRGVVQVDLSLDVVETPGGVTATIEYASDRFDRTTVQRFGHRFVYWLTEALSAPARRVSDLPLLGVAERHQVVREWNDAARRPAAAAGLPDVASTWAARSPDAIALADEVRAVSYGELDRRTAAFARAIGTSLGDDARGGVVAVALDRSVDFVVAALAVARAGAAYLSLDLRQPAARLASFLDPASVGLVVTRSDLAASLPGTPIPRLHLDALGAHRPGVLPEPPRVPGSPAYVIHTSGSTGVPKGVVCGADGLFALLADLQRRAPLGEEDRGSWWTSPGFDVSVYELFAPLAAGGTLCIPQEDVRPDAAAFLDWSARQRVTSAYVPPFFLRDLERRLSDPTRGPTSHPPLRRLLVGVEPIPEPLLVSIGDALPGLTVVNGYGPTEATVCATLHTVDPRCPGADRTPIGRPVVGSEVFLLDRHGAPVPSGTPGELHIGGDGLAFGYLRQPARTAESFVPHPFARRAGERLYATGDLARRLADGTLRFAGRVDDQVKIRGQRIEPREVGAVLRGHPALRDAVVIPWRDDGETRLAAYVAPTAEAGARGDLGAGDDLNGERVESWRRVYDRFYSGEFSEVDSSISLSTWVSSYTGESFPEEEILESVEEAVDTILALDPRRVLEIGCGSGLLLLRIAPRVERYHGTDISPAGLARLRRRLDESGNGFANVTLDEIPAHRIGELGEERFDLVVINEVLQLFPGTDYLESVLAEALRALAPGGRIFLGGVRSLRHLDAFHASLLLHSGSPDLDRARAASEIEARGYYENELILDPAWFETLHRRVPGIERALTRVKSGRHRNELNRFRYDVVLETAPAGAPAYDGHPPLRRLPGDAGLGRIEALLDRECPAALAVDDLPNARLEDETSLLDWLGGSGDPRTLGALRRRIAAGPRQGIDPADLHALAERRGYRALTTWAASGGRGRFDALFVRRDAAPGGFLDRAAFGLSRSTGESPADAGALASRPLREQEIGRLIPRLREFLGERLPAAMVPSVIVVLPRLPLTPSGKVDRRALPEPDAAPGAARSRWERAHAPPRTEAERELAAIWSRILGTDDLGIHDNFFERGGDSILSIQVVARAAAAGLELTPDDLFRHQTIAELAAAARLGRRTDDAAPTVAEQGPITGEVVLTPVQRWFLEQGFTDPDHWNMTLLLASADRLAPGALAGAVAALERHHDALRMRFRPGADGWHQYHAPPGSALLVTVDLAAVPGARISGTIETACRSAQTGLDLTRGPLLRAVLFTGSDDGDRLLLTIHHLVVDGYSYRVLIEDLQTAYRQALDGREIRLPAKTTSFRTWASRQAEDARAPETRAELDHWLAAVPASVPAVPGLRPDRAERRERVRVDTIVLDRDDTAALLRLLPRRRRLRVDQVLLAALVESRAALDRRRTLLVDVEGHGREALDSVDLSRTVGWFTTVFPVWLDLGTPPDGRPERAEAALRRAKEALLSIPRHGFGFWRLRYGGDPGIERRLAELPAADVVFNYLGEFDQVLPPDSPFRPADESPGAPYGPANRRSHPVEIDARVEGDRLHVQWTTSLAALEEEVVECWLAAFETTLRDLLTAALGRDGALLAPVDLPLAGLGVPELERLLRDDPAIEDLYPATPLQEGMLFHSRLAPESDGYLTRVVGTVEPTDPEAFPEIWRAAWHEETADQPALRAAFVWNGLERPLQKVVRGGEPEIETLDWRARGPAEADARFEALLERDCRRRHELDRAPLSRLYLARLDARRYRFVWSHHHALLDGWSIAEILRRVFARCAAHLGEPGSEVLGRPAPPRDYAAHLQASDADAALRHWRGRLKGFEESTVLPHDRAPGRPPVPDEDHRDRVVNLSEEATARLRTAAAAHRLTLATVVQGAWALLVAGGPRSPNDVVFGVTSSHRPPEIPGIDRMAGLLIDTLPARVRVEPNAPLADWLRRLQADGAEDRRHAGRSLTELQEIAGLAPGRALFDSLLVFENYPIDPSLLRSSTLRLTEADVISRTHYPLALLAVPGERLELRLTYDARRFGAADGLRWAQHLRTLLESMVDLGGRVGELSHLSDAERHQVLTEWNDSGPERAGTGLFRWIADQAERTPDRIAVCLGPEHLTYAGLMTRAARLSGHLRRAGATLDSRVGLCVDRRPEQVVAILAILRAGAAYVPLDPSYPTERLRMMAEDAGLRLVVGRTHLAPKLPAGDLHRLFLDAEPELDPAGVPPPMEARDEALVYVVYTSGSTGRPKGTGLSHRSLENLVRWFSGRFATDRRTLQLASLSFDLSFYEMFTALTGGGTVVLAPAGARRDVSLLARALRDERIESLFLSASALQRLAAEAAGGAAADLALADVVSTAEQLRVGDDVRAFFAEVPGARLHNHYGPSESHVVTALPLPEGEETDWPAIPSIGRPIRATSMRLLDPGLEPVAPTAVGELWIAGVSLARGYHDRPALTAERFVPDPHPAEPGGRLYRTGDLARHRPDGTIDYLGRTDHQVKIRGIRVEPGEVEAALMRHPAVTAAAVVVHPGPTGQAELVAYVVLGRPVEGLASELRRLLERILPQAVIPSHFVPLEALPSTPSGKIDRRALPEPDSGRPDLATAWRPPRTSSEHVIAGIWCDILGLDRVGIEDSFFELGGHSISAMRAVERVRETFGVEMPLSRLFVRPTVRDVVEELGRLWGDPAELEEVARTVRELDSLSDDEVARRLAALESEEAS